MDKTIKTIHALTPGIILSSVLAIGGIILSQVLRPYIAISALILAIIFGMIFRNMVGIPEVTVSGVRFSIQRILRVAIVFLGFKLSIAEVYRIGIKGLTVVAIVIAGTLIFTAYVGRKFNLHKELALLIGSGTGICGASAAIAVGSVINAKHRDIAYAVATVTIFGTIAMFIYPVIESVLQLPDMIYGVWTGSSIHEVAQVVAAGFAVSDVSGGVSTIVKLSRVLFLAPIALILGIAHSRKDSDNFSFKAVPIPYFIFGFIAMIFLNSTGIIPQPITGSIIRIDDFLLAIAMAGMGLNTDLRDMKEIGLSPFYTGFIAWLFIAVLSYMLIWILF